MRTTQAERDQWRAHPLPQGCTATVNASFIDALVADADLCARLAARVEELERDAARWREVERTVCASATYGEYLIVPGRKGSRFVAPIFREDIDAALSPPAAVVKE